MVPPFEEFLSNSLSFFVDGKPHSKQDLLEYCVKILHLTDADCMLLTKKGSKPKVDDRVTWVITYYGRAGFLSSERKGRYSYYTITPEGKAFYDLHPQGFGKKDLEDIPSFAEFQHPDDPEDSAAPVAQPKVVKDDKAVVTKQQVLDIYESLDKLQKMGFPVTDEQRVLARDLEVLYVKTEVTKALREQLNPLLSGLRFAHDYLIRIDQGNVDSAEIVYYREFKGIEIKDVCKRKGEK